MSGQWFWHSSGQVTQCTISPRDISVVVIDPTDRKQVERLDDIYQRALDLALPFHSLADVMQDALREFANPTPPKPEEPLGLGAVVEDADGSLWVHIGTADIDGKRWWLNGANKRKWDAISARTTHSEGVTP